METENVINKIRGALALSQNAGTKAEAEQATRMVQMLLHKYNLELSDIARSDNIPVVTKHYYSNGKNNSNILGRLAGVLSEFNFVHVYMTHKAIEVDGNKLVVAAIAFVGREVNVDTVLDLFYKMKLVIERTSAIEFRLAQTGRHGKAWKASFEMGMVEGIYQNLARENNEFLKMKSIANGRTGMELTINLNAENETYLVNSGLKFHKRPAPRIRDSQAYYSGVEHGKDMSTKDKVN